LDQDNSIVVVLLHQADTERGVAIDVLALEAGTSLH
jgi:hypothetical protein